MSDAKKGDFVQIHKTILRPDQRPDNLPASTKSVPYECWIKGFLLDEDAEIGNDVMIETLIGRRMSGTLYQVNPVYDHHFGQPQKEILRIGRGVRERLNAVPKVGEGVTDG